MMDSELSNPASPQDQLELMRAIAEAVREDGYRFITITPASHTIVNARPGNAEAHDLAGVLGWSRPFKQDLLPPELFKLLSDADLLDKDGVLWRSKIRFSSLKNDLFMHSAFPTSAKDSVFFGPDTYKFVDAVSAYLSVRTGPIRRAVDICTGAGPAGITIAKAAPHAEVLLVDINPRALQMAALNAAMAGCSNARPQNSNILAQTDGFFDLVVAHPPYLIDRDARAYRHGGGALGAELAYAIVKASIERLAPEGTLLLFTGIAMTGGRDPFREEIEALFKGLSLGWTYTEVDPDVFGEELTYEPYAEVERIALIVLTATRSEPA